MRLFDSYGEAQNTAITIGLISWPIATCALMPFVNTLDIILLPMMLGWVICPLIFMILFCVFHSISLTFKRFFEKRRLKKAEFEDWIKGCRK